MAGIRQTKAGTYETNIYIGKDENGKRKYKHITAASKREIEAIVRDFRTRETPESIDTLSMTVGDAVKQYIDNREARRGDNALSPSTIAKYHDYLNSELYHDLKKVKISKLSDNIIQRAIDSYAASHSPKSVSLRWGLIRAAVAEIRKNFSPSVNLPRIKRKRLEMPEKSKLQALFKNLRGHGMEIPVLLGSVCGLRRGEIAALDLSKDVDYDKGILRINKDMVLNKDRKYVIKKPKTDAAVRSVQCPSWVLQRLAEARDNPTYKMYLPNSITTGWNRIAKEYEISCSFHGLRHYFASVMESLGVPEAYQMERMGHTTNYMLKRYQEYLKETEYKVDDAMQAYFESISPDINATNDATNPDGVQE